MRSRLVGKRATINMCEIASCRMGDWSFKIYVNIYNEGWVPMCNPVGQCICVFNRSVFLQVFDARVSVWYVSMPATAPEEGIARPQHFVMPLQMKLYELFVARTICKADQSQSYIVALAARMLCDSKEVTFRDTMGHSHRFGCRLLHRSWTSWRSLSLAREEWRLLSKLRLIYVIDTSSCSHE